MTVTPKPVKECQHCGGSGIISGRCSGWCNCKIGKAKMKEAYAPKPTWRDKDMIAFGNWLHENWNGKYYLKTARDMLNKYKKRGIPKLTHITEKEINNNRSKAYKRLLP